MQNKFQGGGREKILKGLGGEGVIYVLSLRNFVEKLCQLGLEGLIRLELHPYAKRWLMGTEWRGEKKEWTLGGTSFMERSK